MPIFGTDTSRYQPLGAYDPGAFEIINGQEPDGAGGDFTATLQRNVADGRPQGVYIWGYPNGGYAVEEVVARTRGVLGGDLALGYWLDHEEAGISQAHIDAALGVADALGVRMGIYTYLNVLPTVNLRGRDLWLAYYPGNNDGTYEPHYSDRARAEGAVIHQFTSSANADVGLDRNVILDEAWYAALVGGVLPSGPAPVGDDVILRATSDSTVNPDVKAGSTWYDSATRLVRADPIPSGAAILDLDGDVIGQISIEKAQLLVPGNVTVNGAGASPEQVDEIVRRALSATKLSV